MKGDEGGVFSKLLFFLKIKINKTQAAQIRNIMQSLSTIIGLSGPIPEVKKSALINDYENKIAYWEESQSSEL